MIRDITLGQFFPGNTIAHRLDPRSKLIVVLLFIVALFLAKSYISYGVMTAVLLFYVIYNRGFNTRGMTADMLPDDLPLAKREEMIAEGNRRALRSQWALYVLLPLLLVLLFDVIYLFLIPEGLFS